MKNVSHHRSQARRRRWNKARRVGQSLRRQGFEPLEGRLLLAADWGLEDDTPVLAATDSSAPAPLLAEGESAAEGEVAPDLVAFAQALSDAGVIFFGADWCPHCNNQKALFEDGAEFLPFVEVTNPDRSLNSVGEANDIESFPTWVFPASGGGAPVRVEGTQTLEELSNLSGIPIPTSNQPSIAPIPDATVADGSPLHVPIDAYNPDGGPLTITVESSNPNVISAELITGSRSARLVVQGRGEIVMYLFEDRASRATDRLIELGEDGFYDADNNDPDISFHRVIENFVVQGGDPTGTGGGGSSLDDFDDHYHEDLQHNRVGVLSYAKTSDDTNNSQFFITTSARRNLDFNHSVAGQVVEGLDVLAGINRTATDGDDKPINPVLFESLSFFEDTENGLVMLKALQDSGEADITVTVRNGDDVEATQTFHVTAEADTVNSTPFLEDIPPVSTPINVPVVIQLGAVDLENDAVLFQGADLGPVDFDFTLNPDTGELVVTPPQDFIGTLEMGVSVRQADGNADTVDTFDTQMFDIVVAPPAPQALDLDAGSDSGASDSDNITNVRRPVIHVSGVEAGAEVRVLRGATVVGSAVALNSEVDVLVQLDLPAGANTLTAVQVLSNQASEASSGLDVTVDITGPQLSSAPGSSVDVGSLFSYDAESDEEGDVGMSYALSGAPLGVTIDAATGVVEWIPSPLQRGPHSFQLLATDAAGNQRPQQIDLDVGGPTQVAFRLEVTDSQGTPHSEFLVGDDLLLNIYVQDISAVPSGVQNVFLDLPLPAGLTVASIDPVFAAGFPNDQTGTFDMDVFDELGASADAAQGGSEALVATLSLTALAEGQWLIQSDPADDAGSDTRRFGETDPVSPNEIVYGNISVEVTTPFFATDDIRNVDEDSGDTTFDVLANDDFIPGFSGVLTVESVTPGSQGGLVSVSPDGSGVVYSPAANFNGEETFTYAITDGVHGSTQGTVTVQVAATNDPPQANDDDFSGADAVDEDSLDNLFDVLDNDSSDPDEGESLRVMSVGATSAGGAVTIAVNGTHLLYDPLPNFEGVETFTYVVSDGNGGLATATVSVEVLGINDPPDADNDAVNVPEDSNGFEIFVLDNDLSMPDSGETLTITSVGSTNQGGVVVIAPGDQSLLYSPATNFNGVETFTYTISDGNGGSAQATVTATVTGANDDPTANDDPASGELLFTRNSGPHAIDVLANDSSDPDVGEVLTVTGVTQGSQGGLVEVGPQGENVSYTPAMDFVGEETFTYTISDGNGGASTATVTVRVQEFSPSSLAGHVYIDNDNDGQKDSDESPVAGVTIQLTGVDESGNPVELSEVTDSSGAYQFTNLAPGSYAIVEMQPPSLDDGRETVGTQGGSLTGNDRIDVQLPEGSDGVGNNFGERGRRAELRSIRDLFYSTSRQNVFAAVDPATGSTVHWTEGKWSPEVAVDVSYDQQSAMLDLVVNDSALEIHKSLPLATYAANLNSLVGSDDNFTVLRLLSYTDFANGGNGNGNGNGGNDNGGGEGEPDSAVHSAADWGAGEGVDELAYGAALPAQADGVDAALDARRLRLASGAYPVAVDEVLSDLDLIL